MDLSKEIADLFMRQDVVSFAIDIAPIIMGQYQCEFLERPICHEVEQHIARSINLAIDAGRTVVGIPKFLEEEKYSALAITDFEYRCSTRRW